MKNFSWDCVKYPATIYRSSGYLHEISEIEENSFESLHNLQKEIKLVCANTEAFLFENLGVNVLLWGARGC